MIIHGGNDCHQETSIIFPVTTIATKKRTLFFRWQRLPPRSEHYFSGGNDCHQEANAIFPVATIATKKRTLFFRWQRLPPKKRTLFFRWQRLPPKKRTPFFRWQRLPPRKINHQGGHSVHLFSFKYKHGGETHENI